MQFDTISKRVLVGTQDGAVAAVNVMNGKLGMLDIVQQFKSFLKTYNSSVIGIFLHAHLHILHLL